MSATVQHISGEEYLVSSKWFSHDVFMSLCGVECTRPSMVLLRPAMVQGEPDQWFHVGRNSRFQTCGECWKVYRARYHHNARQKGVTY